MTFLTRSLPARPPLPRPLLSLGRRYARLLVIAAVLLLAWLLGSEPSEWLVMLIGAVIGGGILLHWPAIGLPGLVAAIAVVPFSLGTGTESALNLAMLGVAGLSGLWLVQRLLTRDLRLRPSPANGAWLALILSAGVSILAGRALLNPLISFKDNFTFVQLAQWSMFILAALAFWLGANAIEGRRALERLTWLILALGVVFLALQYRLLPVPVARLLGFTGALSRVWFVGLAGAFALFDTRRDLRVRGLLLAMAVLIVVSGRTVGAGWASGWLPQAITLATLVALRLGAASHKLAIVAAVPAAAFAWRAWPTLVAAERWSLDTRAIAWSGLVDVMGDQWLFGMGLATYWHAWRDLIGSFSYFDPTDGNFHYTLTPQVNMHNNYIDVYGQAGLVGLLAFAWLLAALGLHAWRVWRSEPPGFGSAYAAAGLAAFVGMLAAGMLGDWLIPFVYNIGLGGFREASLAWLLLGGVVVISSTSPDAETDDNEVDSASASPPHRAGA